MSNRVTWNLFIGNGESPECNHPALKQNIQRKREINDLLTAILAISSFQDNRSLIYILGTGAEKNNTEALRTFIEQNQQAVFSLETPQEQLEKLISLLNDKLLEAMAGTG